MKIKSAEDRNNREGKEENDWRMKSYFNVAKKRRKEKGNIWSAKKKRTQKGKGCSRSAIRPTFMRKCNPGRCDNFLFNS